MRYLVFGERVENVLHFQNETEWNATSLQQLANIVQEAWEDQLRALQHTQCKLNEVYVRDLNQEIGAEYTNSVGENGTKSGEALPNNVTIAISFRSGFTGRSTRGRMYWPGLEESQVDNNELDPTFNALLISNFAEFIDQILDDFAGVTHVIVSYCSEGNWRTEALITPVQTYLFTDVVVDSMRRRLPGRGN